MQFFLKNGFGFHSNDARTILHQQATYTLPRVYGTDLGAKISIGKNLFLQTTVWHLFSEQEFVYVGDAGIVEPSGRARRVGIDWLARYQINSFLIADMDISYARARSVDEVRSNDYIPLAPVISSIGGLTALSKKGFSGSLRYRLLGKRPANEDYSSVAKGYFLLDGVLNYKYKKLSLNLSLENITNTKWNEAQFETTSKLKNEALPVSEIHFTPGIPFFIKAGLAISF
jgi:outer membrane receptor protein involved in Fe transport